MAVHRLLNQVFTAPANGDLSTLQYRAMYQLNTGNIDVLENEGTVPIGILLNKPAAASRAARIAGPGCICKMTAGAAIDEGQLIQAVAGGRGSPAAVGTAIRSLGMALTPASSGEVFTVLVNPQIGVVTAAL